jgi:hypothetical protein
MDCRLKCSRCGQESEVRDLNLFRITVPCIQCGYVNGISQMLGNAYGLAVQRVAFAALKGLTGIKVTIQPDKAVRLVTQAEFAINQAIGL